MVGLGGFMGVRMRVCALSKVCLLVVAVGNIHEPCGQRCSFLCFGNCLRSRLGLL